MEYETRVVRMNEKWRPLLEIKKYPDVRYIIIYGGRGGGKSFAIATALFFLNHLAPRNTLITRYTMSSSGDSIVAEVNEKLDLLNCGDDWKFNKSDSTLSCDTNGARMIFRGIIGNRGNQTARLKSLQGIDTWWCEEANEMVEKDFDTINLSVRSKFTRNLVLISFNPTNEGCWIFKRWFKRKINGRDLPDEFSGVLGNTLYIHTSFLDNIKHLDEGFLNDANLLKEANPKRYNNIFLGHFAKGNDMGFQENWFKRYSIHTIKRHELNVYILVDPASGKRKRKEEDYTVMSVWGLGADNNYYLLDGVRSKMNLQEKWRTLKSLHYKWKPLRVGYEEYGMQSDTQHFYLQMEQENYRFNMVELGGTKSKKDRIEAMIPLHEAGRFFYPHDRELMFRDHEGLAQDYILQFFSDEYMVYPLNLNKSGFHDDMLDCHARILDPSLNATFPKLESDTPNSHINQKPWDPYG